MKHALLRTLPGRAIVIGVAIKLIVFVVGLATGAVPAFLGVADTVAGIAIVAGSAYFLLQLFALAKRRLLWRVRRKLILSYIFIGFVPAILLVAFFALCGLLLFFNFSSYLVQMQVRSIGDQAAFLAAGAALEIQRAGGRDVADILKRKRAAARSAFPGVSMTAVPVDSFRSPLGARARRAAVPAWIGCDGFNGRSRWGQRGIRRPRCIRRRADCCPRGRVPGLADTRLRGHRRSAAGRRREEERIRRDTGVYLRGVSLVDVSGRAETDPNEPLRRRAPGGPSQLDHLSRLPRLDQRDARHDGRVHAAEHHRDLRPDFGGAGTRRQPQLRPRAPPRPSGRRRRTVPGHRGGGARRRLRPGEVDHRLGPRAVRGHRARAPARFLPPNRRDEQRSARRARRLVQ